MKKFVLSVDFSFEFDIKFWAIIPNLNINLHSKSLELEILCFALYIDFEGEKIEINSENNNIINLWKID
jgi:hypothetical protein